VSGTPIQNSLLDFHGIFKFLRFAPYDDLKVFDQDISSIWRTKSVDEAGETFKKLLSCVMIRRTKAMLVLPSRHDHLIRVPFSREEDRHYRETEQPIMDMLTHTTGAGSQAHVPWMTAIQQINKLRLLCNLGFFTPPQADGVSELSNPDDKTSVIGTRFSMEGGSCEMCLQPIETSILDSGLRDPAEQRAYYSDCSKLYCAECSASLQYRSPDPCACVEETRSCQLHSLSSFLPFSGLTPIASTSPSSKNRDYSNDVSSKIWTLVSQIRSRPEEKQ